MPPIFRKNNKENSVECSPTNSWVPWTSKLIEWFPLRNVFREFFFDGNLVLIDMLVDIFRSPHHCQWIWVVFWRMRVFFCIGKSVMHSVHYTITIRWKIIRTLGNPSKNKTQFFTKFRHSVGLMSCVTMKEKSLKK